MRLSFPSRFVFLLLVATSFLVHAQRAIPAHNAVWVHDEANVLSASAKAQMEALLQAHRDSTSTQIAVLIVPSLEGEDIDGYSVRVFEAWKLGQKEKTMGCCFLLRCKA